MNVGVKLILLRCAGFNNVDLQAAKNMELQFYVFLLIHHMQLLNMQWQFYKKPNRRLHKAYTKVKDNNFALSGLLGLDLHNKVAGIMGTG